MQRLAISFMDCREMGNSKSASAPLTEELMLHSPHPREREEREEADGRNKKKLNTTSFANPC